MLQRAASNAYSWWWASHIRTKQSKWLEQNLQDMEEKVQYVLKLIEEDGDSFAKRAEMYYKKRPELIHFVEESYRAYRALAERYDHISTELQNANNTIAYVFPEQVQFAMEEDDETSTPKFPKKTSEGAKANVPKVPNIPKDFKAMFASATKKSQPTKSKNVTPTATKAKSAKSGLSKDKGLQEIDSIQKQILALQTEKEFVKSSYESGLAKYWEIEQQIEEKQDKVSSLQDEFGSGIVIEDDEARTLMASAALKSCQDSLAQLQEKQETSAKEAAIEQERVKNVQEKLKSLKIEFSNGQVDEEKPHAKREPTSAAPEKILAVQENTSPQQSQNLELLRKKLKEHFEVESNTSLTVTELAERIDQLVNKVISLETAVSSQTALITRLRTETDDLQGQIRTLEDDKATLISGKNDLSEKVRSMEEKLHGIQDLNQNVEDQKKNLQTHITEAHLNLDHLSERLHSVKPDEELQETTEKKEEQTVESKPQGFKEVEGSLNHSGSLGETQNVKQGEETEASSKMHVEFKEEIGALNSGGVEEPKDVKQTEELQETTEKKEQIAEPKPQGFEEVEGPPIHSGSLGEIQNVKQGEETEASSKMHVEFKEEIGAVYSGGVEEPKDVKQTEELEVAGKMHKDINDKEVFLNPDHLEEPQYVKADEEIHISDSSQKEKELSTEVSFSLMLESKELEEKPGHLDCSEQVADNKSETCNVQKMEEEVVHEQATKKDDEPDWKQLFMNGMENREQVLLKEYTTTLRNYKEIKKKLNGTENKPDKKTGGDDLFDAMVQLRELKSSNAKKDEQIRILRQKLNLMNVGFGDQNEANKSMVSESPKVERDVTDDLKNLLEEQDVTSEIEQKFRTSIDEVLEENLEFWLRFSTTFHEIQKFETETKDLQSELSKLEEKQRKQDGSSTAKYSLKSDAKPLYKHLREIHTELSVWLETSMLLKDELKSRFSSLCDIQEEIKAALKESAEDEDFTFTSYQAAKFQGEILNMKQENNKVADELQAGLDHVTTLQLEVEKTLAKLNQEFKLSGSKNSLSSQLPSSGSRSRVPLRSFIFGIKPKRQKPSIFSCMHPGLHRKYHGLKSSSNT